MESRGFLLSCSRQMRYSSMRAPARLCYRCFEFIPFPFFICLEKPAAFLRLDQKPSVRFLCCEAKINACAVARAQLPKRFTGRFSAFQEKEEGKKGPAPAGVAFFTLIGVKG